MSNEPNEDLIEATIRRIQAQNASAPKSADATEEEDPIEATIRRVQSQAQASQSEDVQETPEGEYASASMNRIEDTIRRVREQSAAFAASEDAPALSEGLDEDPIEATIRRVQAQAATQAEADNTNKDDPPADDATDDEDEIAATIRRVQMQAAAHAEQVMQDEGATDDGGEENDPIAATIRRVAAAKAARAESEFEDDEDSVLPHNLPEVDHVGEAILAAETNGRSQEDAFAAPPAVQPLDDDQEATPPEPTTWPGRDERMLGEPATWEIAAQRLEQGLQDTQREVRQMTARLDALLPALERAVASAATPPPALKIVAPQQKKPQAAEEWDDSPTISTTQARSASRPPVHRDPSPQTATAAELVEESARENDRPAAVAPRLRALDSEGNLAGHLPRQYRITVEDKRRGVDLVPLHRAMQALNNVKDMSLLSYSNGVAIVAIESVGAIDPELLREAVGRAMSRETKIEVHNEQTMVVKIQEE